MQLGERFVQACFGEPLGEVQVVLPAVIFVIIGVKESINDLELGCEVLDSVKDLLIFTGAGYQV